LLIVLSLSMPTGAGAATDQFPTVTPNPFTFALTNGVYETTVTVTNVNTIPMIVGYPGSDSVSGKASVTSTPSCANPVSSWWNFACSLGPNESVQIALQAATDPSGDCFWIYATFDFSGTTGVCEPLALEPIAIASSQLVLRTFYPLVRDGYLDYTTYSFTLNEPGTGSVQVLDETGLVIRYWKFTDRSSLTVNWWGRTQAGTRAKTGYYRVRVKAHANGTSVTSPSFTAHLKSG
jgi:hypothetical protein